MQLKRRHDLVPNLVETVKGYAAHESQTFEKTTQARAAAMQAQSVEETAQAEQKLTQALADVKAVAENYPELRATENFQQLSRNLSELEDEIQASRRIYNSNVQSYNTDIEQFPGSIVANQGNFTEKRVLRDRGPGRPRAGLGQLRQIGPLSRISGMTATTEATLWICESCGFIYDPAIGDPDGGIPPGTEIRGHPPRLVLPRLRRPDVRLPPPGAGRGLDRPPAA